MLVMHAHGSLAMGAHAIHYAIVGVGILGLVALLSPQLLTDTRPRDEHEARVQALRTSLGNQLGQSSPDHAHPGLAAGNLPATALDPTLVASQEARLHRVPVLTAAERVSLPLAVVSSAAAAGVHAAVGPEHFRESLLFGAFFAVCTLAQLLWAGAAAVHASRGLLLLGALGNLSVLALWVVTRTMGLPFGLLDGPEALGPWDLACAGWELVVVCCCIAMLQSRDLPASSLRLPSWRLWHQALPTYVVGSVLLLVALSLSGAGA